jgi:hypothetical protein
MYLIGLVLDPVLTSLIYLSPRCSRHCLLNHSNWLVLFSLQRNVSALPVVVACTSVLRYSLYRKCYGDVGLHDRVNLIVLAGSQRGCTINTIDSVYSDRLRRTNCSSVRNMYRLLLE